MQQQKSLQQTKIPAHHSAADTKAAKVAVVSAAAIPVAVARDAVDVAVHAVKSVKQ